MIAVVQGNGHIGESQGLSGLCPGKNNILHVSAPELFGALFSQNPADRVCHITFSAAVRAYDTCDAIMKFKGNFICKGLESLHINAF